MATSKKNDAGDLPPKKGERAATVSSKDLPKKTLEDALRVARAIKDNYGKEATWEDIAKAMGFSPKNPNNQYFLWSATAYGIVDKDEKDNYKVTEIGRKILAPTYDGEDREGRRAGFERLSGEHGRCKRNDESNRCNCQPGLFRRANPVAMGERQPARRPVGSARPVRNRKVAWQGRTNGSS